MDNKKNNFRLFSSSVLVCLSLIVLLSTCKKDKSEPSEQTINLTQAQKDINKFIWEGLHNYYLWVDNVPALLSENYSSETNLENYLNQQVDQQVFFYSLLYEVDKWSWIVDDYEVLENQFQGITLSMGYNFMLIRLSGSNDIFGYVRYVLDGSPAGLAGIERGDIFIKVNGTQLTIDNYEDLLFGNESYILSMAYISDYTIIPLNEPISLTATEIHENPIFYDTCFTTTAGKTGYLIYNGFTIGYDHQLNSVFNYFKNENIQHLILDLRYNHGGSGLTATYLASMIYTTDTTKVFYKTQYNSSLQYYLEGEYGSSYFNTMFEDKIEVSDGYPAEYIVSLNLSEVYIIATESSASASELLINGLIPYMNVITIGSNTYGKYVGSVTLKDYDEEGNLNPLHTWAMQPIIMKAANVDGTSDFINGLPPTIEAYEDIADLSTLGNEDEALLKVALDHINGITTKAAQKMAVQKVERIADSKDLIPHGKEMYFPAPAKNFKK